MTVSAFWHLNKRYCAIFPKVLRLEGGFVNNPKDKGGPTKFGVAYNFHAGRLKQYGINEPLDIMRLTESQAIDFYYKYFWIPSQADELPDAKLAYVYWDMAVNSGIAAADTALSKLPNQKFWAFKGDGENIDFFWRVVMNFLAIRMFSYTSFKDWASFGKGWVNRLGKVQIDLATM